MDNNQPEQAAATTRRLVPETVWLVVNKSVRNDDPTAPPKLKIDLEINGERLSIVDTYDVEDERIGVQRSLTWLIANISDQNEELAAAVSKLWDSLQNVIAKDQHMCLETDTCVCPTCEAIHALEVTKQYNGAADLPPPADRLGEGFNIDTDDKRFQRFMSELTQAMVLGWDHKNRGWFQQGVKRMWNVLCEYETWLRRGVKALEVARLGFEDTKKHMHSDAGSQHIERVQQVIAEIMEGKHDRSKSTETVAPQP